MVTMHESMETDGKDQIRNNYGTTFLSVNDIECKSSVMLYKQHTPEKAQDGEECLNETISKQKKKEHRQKWNIKTNLCIPKNST